MRWHDDYGWGGEWLPMTFTMLVIWALIAVLVVWSVRTLAGTGGAEPPADDPRRLLDERLARGEIDADDYKARLELLGERRR